MPAEQAHARVTEPLISLTGLHKWFGGVHALNNARMVLERTGVVHALLGQNGSGKSTMLNILSGQLRPDEGKIAIGGKQVTFRSPLDALSRGISMVSQETALAEDLTVAENVLLGHRLIKGRIGIDWRATQKRAREILEQIGTDLDPARIVRSLRTDQRQLVEIARALSTDVKILVLDEPTSALTDEQIKGLFATIRRIKQQGVSVIYVSHRLPEIFEIADEVTLLRDGVTVAEGKKDDFSPHSIVKAMVGEEKPLPAREIEACEAGSPVLRIRDLSLEGEFSNVDFDVCEGEIVGLGGLLGSGRRAVLETIYSLRQANSGTMLLSGEPLWNEKPLVAIKRGLGFVPPDRKTQGVVLPMSVQDNLAMIATSEKWRLSNPNNGTIKEECLATSKLLSIKAELDAAVNTLSGGNQQKVTLGKWLLHPPKVLLLDEPTRGVDVSAKGEIHRHLRNAASRGIAMLVSSSEYDELCDLCDRVIIFFRGRIVATVPRSEATEARLAALGGGAK
jgi:ABC-type sugar transport system ATPase subunit